MEAPVKASDSKPPICYDVTDWAHNHGAKVQTVTATNDVIRRAPQTIEPQIADVFSDMIRVTVPEKNLISVKNASLIGRPGFIVLPDGMYVAETLSRDAQIGAELLEHDPVYYEQPSFPGVDLAGTFFSLTFMNPYNYYHWIHDALVKLHGVIEKLPPETRFIVPAKLKPFQLEGLRAIGIDEDILLTWSGTFRATLSSLYFSVPHFTKLFDTSAPLKWFKDCVIGSLGIGHREPHKRIYVSRRNASHDRLVNEMEVQECLRRFGVETYLLEELTFHEQVSLFGEAELIVGTGAGLTNLLFAPTRAQILEIQEPSHIFSGYWTMADALGHDYWYVTGETVPNPSSRIGRSDIFMPIPKLQNAMEKIA